MHVERVGPQRGERPAELTDSAQSLGRVNKTRILKNTKGTREMSLLSMMVMCAVRLIPKKNEWIRSRCLKHGKTF
jgi:hypothetical protein